MVMGLGVSLMLGEDVITESMERGMDTFKEKFLFTLNTPSNSRQVLGMLMGKEIFEKKKENMNIYRKPLTAQ